MDPRGSSNTYAASDVNSHANANSNEYTCIGRHSSYCSRPNTHTHTDRHPDSNSDADSIPDPHAHSCPNSNPNPHAHAHTDCHSYSCAITDPRHGA